MSVWMVRIVSVSPRDFMQHLEAIIDFHPFFIVAVVVVAYLRRSVPWKPVLYVIALLGYFEQNIANQTFHEMFDYQ